MTIFVVGCGSIGRRHATNLRALGVEDLLLFDEDHRRSEALAAKLHARKVNTVEEAYDRKPCAALICTPTSRHLQQALEALKNDCHLFVEKPISHSLDGTDHFLAEIERRQKILLVGYNFRFDPLMRELKNWLGQGRIGHVTSARIHSGSYLAWRHPWEDYRVGYAARQELGGGVILDAVHELDLAFWLFGEPETIYCVGGKISDLEIDVEDTAEILLSCPRSTVSIHLDYVQRPAERWCEIIGERGQIKADLFSRELRHFDGESRKWHAHEGACPLGEIYKYEMQHFLDCLEQNCAPLVDGSAAVKSLQLAEAAKQSMQLNQPVQFKEFIEMRSTAFHSVSA